MIETIEYFFNSLFNDPNFVIVFWVTVLFTFIFGIAHEALEQSRIKEKNPSNKKFQEKFYGIISSISGFIGGIGGIILIIILKTDSLFIY